MGLGKMGRPRKPTALKILDGDQPCRINRSEPPSPPGLGDPPVWFGELEREAWADLKARMGEMRVATRADEQAAAMYCSHYAKWRQANRSLADDGLILTEVVSTEMKTRNGTKITTKTTTRMNPMIRVANEATRQMARLLAQFGMTPSARAGLHVQEEPSEDQWQARRLRN
jgi:P27 family predicted phage terminase small subunit